MYTLNENFFTMPQFKEKNRKPIIDAQWCRAMATLLASGLSAEQTFITLKGQAGRNLRLAQACQKALTDVQRGSSLIDALARHNFFNCFQLEQIKIGELSGSLPSTLLNIANRLNKQNERNKKLKAQLKLSQAIIVVGFIAGMILTTIKGGHLLYGIVGLMIILMVTKLIYLVLEADVSYLISGAWKYPVLMNNVRVLQHLFEYYWYFSLSAQLGAGIDPVHALRNLHDLFPSPLLQSRTQISQRSVKKGNSLVMALSQAQLIMTHEMKQTLWTGEHTGQLAPTLKHYLELEAKKLEVISATLYEWLPRLYYVVAISVVLHNIM